MTSSIDDSQQKGEGKKRNTALGSIDAFWADFPRLHLAKQIFDGAFELFFLIIAIPKIHADRNKVCLDTHYNETLNIERLRLSIHLMVFIHCLHLCRLSFAVHQKYSTAKIGACKGCLKCLLMDCYCCAGTAIYIYTQISWFIDIGECKEELPNLKLHMKYEIIYQYSRILWYFVSNLLVVLYILAIQRRFQKNQAA